MFEQPLELEPSSKKGIWIAAAIIVFLAGATIYLVKSNGGASKLVSAETPPAVAASQKADPVHDLQVLSARMHQDDTGTFAQWVVQIHNLSPVYTYSDISYQTTYAGADNRVLAQNNGVIPIRIGPNEEQTAQISDIQYPAGTSWYRFEVVSAKEKAQ